MCYQNDDHPKVRVEADFDMLSWSWCRSGLFLEKSQFFKGTGQLDFQGATSFPKKAENFAYKLTF
jgi:hypothetical protein